MMVKITEKLISIKNRSKKNNATFKVSTQTQQSFVHLKQIGENWNDMQELCIKRIEFSGYFLNDFD